MAEEFINEIILALKQRLITDDTYSTSFYLLLRDMLSITSQPHKSTIYESLKHAIISQRNKLTKSTEGNKIIKLLEKTMPSLETLYKTLNNEHNNTASYKHLKKYSKEILYKLSHIFEDSNFITMIHSVLQKEKEENEHGYETFFHGRRWEYELLSDIYSMLFSYKSGKDLKDFIFTHLDDPILDKNIDPRFFASETTKRERLLKEGNIFSRYSKSNPIGLANRQTLLFLNKFLFGNSTNLGSCTIHYVFEDVNANADEINFSIQEIFAMFGYSDIYTMYAQQLEYLQNKHTTLNKHGELLLISIPKNNLNDCVYLTTSGGPQKSLNIPDIGETTDTKQIVDYLDNNPIDATEFVIINTKDPKGGLNPDSGIKVFSFNTVNPAKMKEFKEEKNALLSKIKITLKERDNEPIKKLEKQILKEKKEQLSRE